jgi:hypothetical protein
MSVGQKPDTGSSGLPRTGTGYPPTETAGSWSVQAA